MGVPRLDDLVFIEIIYIALSWLWLSDDKVRSL